MLYFWLALLGGLVGLALSADRLVAAAVAGALHFSLSLFFIGAVVIGFGTSAPEIVVSLIAAWENNPGLAIGNALGSNIANIGLVLGAVALLAAIPFDRRCWRREIPFLLGLALLGWGLHSDGFFQRWDAVLLLLLLPPSLWWFARLGSSGVCDEKKPAMSKRSALLWLLGSGLLLLASARLLIWGASNIALAWGVSELVVGLTVVAIGTSLPELAAALASARRRQHALTAGNLIGSNLFNNLAVLAVVGLARPHALDAAVYERDWPVVVAVTALLWLLLWRPQGGDVLLLKRWQGALLLAAYIGYQAWLFV